MGTGVEVHSFDCLIKSGFLKVFDKVTSLAELIDLFSSEQSPLCEWCGSRRKTKENYLLLRYILVLFFKIFRLQKTYQVCDLKTRRW